MANQTEDDTEKEKVMRHSVDHGMGTVRHNAVNAMLYSKLCKPKTERKRTGKGSYTRKAKHPGRDF